MEKAGGSSRYLTSSTEMASFLLQITTVGGPKVSRGPNCNGPNGIKNHNRRKSIPFLSQRTPIGSTENVPVCDAALNENCTTSNWAQSPMLTVQPAANIIANYLQCAD